MRNLELIGGPLDGAQTEENELLKEGQNIFIEDEGGLEIVYTVHDGFLEFNSRLTFGV